jgi:DNA-binding MarR family transcriptional regulator
MHITQAGRADLNVIGAWVLAVADAMRLAVEESAGLSGAGPAALVAVVADPGIRIDDLKRVLGLTHPGTVRLVDRLVDRGWVERRPGTGRTVHVMPTRNGRQAEKRLIAAREQAVADLMAVLAAPQRRQLARAVAPMLSQQTRDLDSRRRLCRLCDRPACAECPVRNTKFATDTT